VSDFCGPPALDLDAIESRVVDATEGPWVCDTTRDHDGIGWAYVRMPDDGARPRVDARLYDCEFIAHARQDVPTLVSEVRRLREILQEKVLGYD